MKKERLGDRGNHTSRDFQYKLLALGPVYGKNKLALIIVWYWKTDGIIYCQPDTEDTEAIWFPF